MATEDNANGATLVICHPSARALEIFEANRAVFVNPDVVPPGAVLFIPEPTHAAPVLLPN